MSISVIVPAYNEAELLPITIQSLRSIPELSEIIVVDDGSRDNTTKVARRYADQVVTSTQNRGKGAALQQGIKVASGDIFLFIDSDLGKSAVLSRYLLRPILRGQADMSIAIFPPPAKAGFGLVKGLARWGIRSLTGYEMNAPLSGQRALTREAAAHIRTWDGRFGIEVGMTIDLLREGLTIIEVPIPFKHRETGRNLAGFWHRGKQCLDVGRMLRQKW
ncbi:MAG TPA: glycosyltransferase family 2 protein [Bacillota bacterium]|nr:glycosyltransferase family 2 protein [Bacillota bacterium]